jgi:hypothetical protein
MTHAAAASRAIGPDDAGRRVYAVFFPQRDRSLYFELQPSPTLRVAGWIRTLISFAAGLAVLVLTIRPRWPVWLRACSIFTAAYLLTMWVVPAASLGRNYPPHAGGGDGLFHDDAGRRMALAVGLGDLVEGLKGEEPVYWFTPGTRYLRMAEKLIFGDTNHLFSLLLACVPIVAFYLSRHFLSSRRAWAMTAIYLVMPVGNWSFLQHLLNAGMGYGDAIGGGCFLLGLLLALRTRQEWGGVDTNLALVCLAGACLAASIFIRPNFVFAAAWVWAAYVWVAMGARDRGAAVALTAGIALTVWMPFHNWFYGGELYLISKSGSTFAVTLGLGDYLAAAGSALTGHFDTASVAATSRQIKGWLAGPGFSYQEWLQPVAWIAHGIKLLSLLVAGWLVVQWAAQRFSDHRPLAIVALASICAHVPMLFVFNTDHRYSMLAWDLGLFVLAVHAWSGAVVAVRPEDTPRGWPAPAAS